MVRLTAPSLNEAENLRHIKAALNRRGVRVPLIADIHFTPNAALKAAEYVEKVRINPGNYADKKKFAEREYTDSEYEAELERIEQRFRPLVLKLKQYGVAMRIGTNHGSLSDRIMNRFGDTPQGMVESALEHTRLLAARMDEEGMDYPFHLGVTEAGDGVEGRVKSAIGIGALLEDGIGDTIRVSLTEDAVCELPAAYAIAAPYNRRQTRAESDTPLSLGGGRGRELFDERRNPYGYDRRFSHEIGLGSLAMGGGQPVRVELATTVSVTDLDGTLAQIDALTVPAQPNDPRLRQNPETPLLSLCVPLADLADVPPLAGLVKIVTAPPCEDDPAVWDQHVRRALMGSQQHGTALEWRLSPASVPPFIRDPHGSTLAGLAHTAGRLAELASLFQPCPVVFSLDVPGAAAGLSLSGRPPRRPWPRLPLAPEDHAARPRRSDVPSRIQLGALLCDGFGDSIQIDSAAAPAEAVRLSYTILQAARLRMSKTEFISCPSCGRTLFNLQTTTERIKSRMSHLKDVKIAIMGCIVNGPGEMADADFGYVGSGPGKISLYVGKECVERNIPSDQAEERLLQLIKDHGKWVDGRLKSPNGGLEE
ncbi:4-hydroxy-3-methylbut-2-en-1-yl diphosphate synthase (flavodoxin) [Geodia barretti]|uniref:4-hydroxy-3-methylbut-2-en-1-yl diphosphate synthase (Flavodoxin) n=1 Tax=Geodia barretti TaxID=519541 RepID=A0AA35SJT5_GEOBA|nr:4-hydroxy-3-methylbut-2-en-1-yl diphosphate synthase (flavodoxin) [Geodia barretti]